MTSHRVTVAMVESIVQETLLDLVWGLEMGRCHRDGRDEELCPPHGKWNSILNYLKSYSRSYCQQYFVDLSQLKLALSTLIATTSMSTRLTMSDIQNLLFCCNLPDFSRKHRNNCKTYRFNMF